MTNAHVYWMEWWRRHESPAPQRAQYPGAAAATGRDSRLQTSQETSPTWAAVNILISIGILNSSTVVDHLVF
jgi:hypothetical protein